MKELNIINNSLFKDLKLNKEKIKVISFDNLTMRICVKNIMLLQLLGG